MFKLLIVDDDPELLYSLERSLKSASLGVLTASSAGEGVELARTCGPAAVIMDVRLPDMSGLDAFQKIREPEIYQHVCSATDRVVIEEAIRFAHGHLGKASELLGISRNTLRAKIRALGLAVEKQLLADSARDAQELSDDQTRE